MRKQTLLLLPSFLWLLAAGCNPSDPESRSEVQLPLDGTIEEEVGLSRGRNTYTTEEKQEKWEELLEKAKKPSEELSKKMQNAHNKYKFPDPITGKKKLIANAELKKLKDDISKRYESLCIAGESCMLCLEDIGKKHNNDKVPSGIFTWPCGCQSCVACTENWMNVLMLYANPITCPGCFHNDPFNAPDA